MTRETLILDAMDAWSRREMRWGVDDCMLAVADVVLAFTGKDAAQGYRGRYRTRLGAMRLVGAKGTLGVARRAARRFGWKSIKPSEAKVGDVGLIPMRLDSSRYRKPRVVFAAAICRSEEWFIARGQFGFAAVRSSHVRYAWRVK